MRSAPSIDPDITRASTLAAAFYRDPAIHAAARERVFTPSWQFVGDVSLVKAPGQTHPFTLLEGCLDEPLLLTRDHQDQLHCLSNVCTHRGNIVCEGGGVERTLRCRYHGRRFGLDGRFQHMPEFEKAANFPSERDNLPRLPLERWGPLLFTSLTGGTAVSAVQQNRTGETPVPLVSFNEWIKPLIERVGWMPLDEFKFDPTRSREYLVNCNWALYCDNYLEGFHIPYVHAGLNATLDYGKYRTELFTRANVQIGVATAGEPAFDLPPASPDHGQVGGIAGYYFWLFPNTMFNFYPWGLSINVVKPLAVDRTRVSFLSYVWDAAKLDAGGAGAGLDKVEREDEAIVESVQRGVRSRLYERGRYSPTREQGVHQFHTLLTQALAG